jgi:hypothetical protein
VWVGHEASSICSYRVRTEAGRRRRAPGPTVHAGQSRILPRAAPTTAEAPPRGAVFFGSHPRGEGGQQGGGRGASLPRVRGAARGAESARWPAQPIGRNMTYDRSGCVVSADCSSAGPPVGRPSPQAVRGSVTARFFWRRASLRRMMPAACSAPTAAPISLDRASGVSWYGRLPAAMTCRMWPPSRCSVRAAGMGVAGPGANNAKVGLT